MSIAMLTGRRKKHLYVSYDEYHNLVESWRSTVYQSGAGSSTLILGSSARGAWCPGDILS
jgi:hypoxanthine phosphoribosyltransferase